VALEENLTRVSEDQDSKITLSGLIF